MNEKLVSVIIPTYNRAHSVVDAVRSVQEQSYPNVQIIVIDDGSRDNTAEIIGQFADVEYYFQENRGQAGARNTGLKYAKGEYVASLDSDDIWHPNFLTVAVNCLEKHDLDFVFLNWTATDGRENFLDFWERTNHWRKFVAARDEDWNLIESKQLRRLFLIACPTPTSSLLMRRSSGIAWNEETIIGDDWLMMLEMVVSKPCRAAFTLSPHWLKRVFGDNVYDGRDVMQVSENTLRDDLLMARCLNPRLTATEKLILRKRMACNHLNFGHLNWKREHISKIVFYNVVKAFSLAPVGISYYLLEIFVNHLKNRLMLPNEKVRKVNEG